MPAMAVNMTQSSSDASTETAKGARVYTPLSLKIYNVGVFGIVSPYGWRCPAQKLVAFFNRNIPQTAQPDASSPQAPPPRVLDIGVGTGYFPVRAPLTTGTELVLVDLNTDCLDDAKSSIERAHPDVGGSAVQVVGDFLAQGDEHRSLYAEGRLPPGGFDAISLMFLLHCLPGPPARKAEALVRTKALLRPGGVLFGATILAKNVRPNLLARFVLWLNNYLGIFDNYEDSAASFAEPLRKSFHDVRVEVVGCMLLFEARNPK